MESAVSTNPSLDTPLVYFEIKQNILFASYKKGITITLDGAKEIVKNRLAFTKNVPHRVIVIDQGMKSISKEARDYLSEDGAIGLIAGALVMKTIYGSYIGNFFLQLTKPPFPTKLFTDEEHALKWLLQFPAENLLPCNSNNKQMQ